MKFRDKLFAGFLIVVLITAGMGLFAIQSVNRLSDLTNALFERPMMASNFARSALSAFTLMDRSLASVAKSGTAAESAAVQKAVEEFTQRMHEDLRVVQERIPGREGAALADETVRLFDDWERDYEKMVRDPRFRISDLAALRARKNALFTKIYANLDLLVELATEQGFDHIQTAEDSARCVFRILVFMIAVTTLAGILITLFLSRGMVGPLLAMKRAMTELAGGDMTVEIPAVERKDEIGEMEKALVTFKESALKSSELERLTRDLRMARDQAQSANRPKSEFLANMSHELRTPLNAIIGFSEIIKTETLGPVGSVKYRDYAEEINDSGLHLLAVINDILDLSNIESRIDELGEETVDIPDVICSILVLTQQQVDNSGVELSVEVQDDISLLRADKRKLKQILLNLLNNTIKFTETGGKVTFGVWCRADSGFVFQITDTGIGTAADDIAKALSQFGQVDSDLNRKYECAGLGLPLAKVLVEPHGGSLDLQSTLGVGTTVTVRFPAARIVRMASVETLPAGDNLKARRETASN